MQSSSPKVKVSIAPNHLSTGTKEAMWQVYHKFYHYDQAQFMERIKTNNYYSFYTINERIVGFTGLRINQTELNGKKQLLIYFGQTVIDPAFRGQALIPRTAFKLCLKFWRKLLISDLYFWADALTYKAYLVFAKTVPQMYPTWKRNTPKDIKSIVDHLGQTYYCNNYCVQTGTVSKDKVLVNDTTMKVPAKYREDKDICFYLQANPKYIDGYGLLTITHMDRKNIGSLIQKCLKKMFQREPQQQEQEMPKEIVLRSTSEMS
ncbi:MAG: hypothetical protein R2824_19305 [Saprospiraceae bacterium]|nr:hypothetical protein [Lewinella sp.]